MAPSSFQAPLRVAVTGATGDLGLLLLPLLEADPRVGSILALDIAKPEAVGNKVDYRRVDLAQPGAETELLAALGEEPIDALYHLAFIYGRVHNASFAHELEVIGSMHVLSAASQRPIRRLILPSLTALYGARAQNPALLREDAPLMGCAGSRFINDKVEVEQQLMAFGRSHPQTRVIVLRFAPIVGPSVDNPLTRLLRTRLVPTLLGFDPLWQVLHEADAARALHLSLHTRAQGVFNVAAPGPISLAGLIQRSGGATLPLPPPLARAAIRVLETAGVSSVPTPLLDYFHYSWVADGERARRELGFEPRFDAPSAAATLRRS